MPIEKGVLAVFFEPAAAAQAVRSLRGAGFGDVRAAMPAPFPELVEALGRPRSLLGWVTFPGALLGTALGLGLTIGTSLAWPLVTGGKPIVSLPPFVIVVFEVTVLIGSLVNLLALVVGAYRGGRARPIPGEARFSGDRIGVFAAGAPLEAAERILRESGAEQVHRVD